MKLNGWQRLWVVLSGFYLIAIISFAAIEFPQISHIRHSESFNIGFQEIRPLNFLKNWDDEISKPEFQKLDSDQQQWKFVQFLDDYAKYFPMDDLEEVTTPDGYKVHLPKHPSPELLAQLRNMFKKGGKYDFGNLARPLNDDEAKEFASSKKNENSPVKRTLTFEEASTPAEEKPWEKYKASRTKNDLAPAITGDMPNGYSIVFSPLLSANERDQIGKRYNEMLNIKLSHVRSLFLVKALFFWLIPVIFSYTCGWSLGWIYRGFKK